MNIKDMVGNGKTVQFLHFEDGKLVYATECGFEFPVPVEDAGTGRFLSKDKAMLFMRYIRKHITRLTEEAQLLEQLKEKHANDVVLVETFHM